MENVTASDGQILFLDGAAMTWEYNPDGTVAYCETLHDGGAYRQTYTWTAGNLVAITRWVRQ
jgi:hypothetical protein